MRWLLILVSVWRWAGLGQGLPSQPYDGTYHFVSSAFPEMDSRGFYEHLFDDIGDYYPSWRRNSLKEYPEGNNVDAEDSPPHVSVVRSKRSVENNRNTELGTNSSDNDLGSRSVNTMKPVVSHSVKKRSPSRHVRGMEMGSSGFHEDTFNSAFGDFITMRRRRMARTAMQKERIDELLSRLSTHSDGANDEKLSQEVFDSLKHPEYLNGKSDGKDKASDLPALLQNLNNLLRHSTKTGYFNPRSLAKRRPEMDSSGFHGDTFGGSFGDFDTMKKKAKGFKSANREYNMYAEPYTSNWLFKRRPEMDSSGFHGDVFGGSFGEFDTMKKRRPEMDSSGFHGDVFGGSFGEFDTMKKRRPEMDSSGFHGDVFGGSFGEFDTMKKRRPEMDSSGFHGDTFGGSFGDFDTMKKRRPEMDSSGFHGDTFGGSFGDFDTMKKRRPEMDSSGFHGDVFGGSFGEFDTMKKRRPEMDSSGFHGDTFGGSFGDFDTMKKRRPEMDSSGFHGDTFGGSFGDFDTMRKRSSAPPSRPHSEVTKRSTNSVPLQPPQQCDCELPTKQADKTDDKKHRFDSKCQPNCPKKV